MSNTASQKRFFAYLDILGFKDLIEINTIEYLEQLYEKFEPALLFSMAATNIRYRLEHLDSQDLPTINLTHLNSLVISDSVLIWTDNDTPKSFVEIITTVKHFLNFCIDIGMPMRGAITMGPLAIKSGKHEKSQKFNSYTTILGKTLTKAYLFENKLNCIGCLVDEECIKHYNNEVEDSEPEENSTPLTVKVLEDLGFLKKYFVPMKNSPVTEEYVINWTYFFGPRLSEQTIRESFSMHGKNAKMWEVEEKILNSLKFLKDTEDDYDLYQKKMAK